MLVLHLNPDECQTSLLHLTHSQTAGPAISALPSSSFSSLSLWHYLLISIFLCSLVASSSPSLCLFFFRPMVAFFHLPASETCQFQSLPSPDRPLTVFLLCSPILSPRKPTPNLTVAPFWLLFCVLLLAGAEFLQSSVHNSA